MLLCNQRVARTKLQFRCIGKLLLGKIARAWRNVTATKIKITFSIQVSIAYSIAHCLTAAKHCTPKCTELLERVSQKDNDIWYRGESWGVAELSLWILMTMHGIRWRRMRNHETWTIIMYIERYYRVLLRNFTTGVQLLFVPIPWKFQGCLTDPPVVNVPPGKRHQHCEQLLRDTVI